MLERKRIFGAGGWSKPGWGVVTPSGWFPVGFPLCEQGDPFEKHPMSNTRRFLRWAIRRAPSDGSKSIRASCFFWSLRGTPKGRLVFSRLPHKLLENQERHQNLLGVPKNRKTHTHTNTPICPMPGVSGGSIHAITC